MNTVSVFSGSRRVEKSACKTLASTSSNDSGHVPGKLLSTAVSILVHGGSLLSGDAQVESASHNTIPHDESTPNCAAADTTVATPASADDQEVQQVCTNASPPIKVIVFGESGVGKSSLINMLMGEPVAAVSNQAVGCTFASNKFRANIGNREVMLYDTAGLNEAEAGTVSPERAIQNLRSLVRSLKTVDLLVYCIRGIRFRKIVADNYNKFRNTICGGDGKVPIVLVITGLENEVSMDDWWDHNHAYLTRYNLDFCGHACITTTRGRAFKDGSGHVFQDLYDVSEKRVVKLLSDHTFGRSITMASPKDTSSPNRATSNPLGLLTLLLCLLWERYKPLTTAVSLRRKHRTERQDDD